MSKKVDFTAKMDNIDVEESSSRKRPPGNAGRCVKDALKGNTRRKEYTGERNVLLMVTKI